MLLTWPLFREAGPQSIRLKNHFIQACKLDTNSDYKYCGCQQKIPCQYLLLKKNFMENGQTPGTWRWKQCAPKKNWCIISIYAEIHIIYSSDEKICESALKTLKHFINLRWHFYKDLILPLPPSKELILVQPNHRFLTDEQT